MSAAPPPTDAPAYPGASPDAALRQALSWLASASLAMRRDLTGLFTDRGRLPLLFT